jgi:general secretion pathway protein J
MRRENGFSLVEVLAATAVFALVSALSVGLLMGALRTEEQGEAVLSDLSDVHRIAALLREDVGQIMPRPVRTAEGLLDPRIFAADIEGTEPVRTRSTGPREILVLTRGGWANPGRLQPRSSLQRVAWVLEADRLYRHAWPYPDAARETEPRRQLLADEISEVELAVLQNGVWVNSARVVASSEGVSAPPDAVRLRYVLPGLGAMEHVVLSPAAEPA